MIDLFDHLTEYPVFFLRMLFESLQNSVEVINYGAIASLCLCLFIKAVDIAEEHTEVVGMVFPEILRHLVAFFVYLANAINVVVPF